jgi:hypothetical protein
MKFVTFDAYDAHNAYGSGSSGVVDQISFFMCFNHKNSIYPEQSVTIRHKSSSNIVSTLENAIRIFISLLLNKSSGSLKKFNEGLIYVCV